MGTGEAHVVHFGRIWLQLLQSRGHQAVVIPRVAALIPPVAETIGEGQARLVEQVRSSGWGTMSAATLGYMSASLQDGRTARPPGIISRTFRLPESCEQ